MLEGELSITLDEMTTTLAPGAFALVPPGVGHAFSNPGSAPAKFLVVVTPGGFERYFDELIGIVGRHGYPPPPEIMSVLGQRYDFEPVSTSPES